MLPSMEAEPVRTPEVVKVMLVVPAWVLPVTVPVPVVVNVSWEALARVPVPPGTADVVNDRVALPRRLVEPVTIAAVVKVAWEEPTRVAEPPRIPAVVKVRAVAPVRTPVPFTIPAVVKVRPLAPMRTPVPLTIPAGVKVRVVVPVRVPVPLTIPAVVTVRAVAPVRVPWPVAMPAVEKVRVEVPAMKLDPPPPPLFLRRRRSDIRYSYIMDEQQASNAPAPVQSNVKPGVNTEVDGPSPIPGWNVQAPAKSISALDPEYSSMGAQLPSPLAPE